MGASPNNMRMAFFSTEPTESFYQILRANYGHVAFLPKLYQKRNSARNSISQHGWLILTLPKSKAALIPALAKEHGVDVIKSGWWRLEDGANILA